MRSAIRKHLRDFIAIVALVLIAAFVGGYVLAHQRLNLPGWVPIFGRDFFTLKGEFQTAQAVTPGQGQTVDIAGVQVGQISNVDLVGGRAIVTMQLKKRYDRVYPNAHMLLRPKTGLKDMIVELDPGSAANGSKPVKDGFTVPIANTQPDVNLDEILAVLDTDTRTYLQLLLHGAATGLTGQGGTLGQVIRRFEPTARDTAKLTSLLQQRQANIKRSITNFGKFAQALAASDQQLGTFVDSSNTVFRHFANQDANLQQTIRLLPAALSATNKALAQTKAFADQAGPALAALEPTARNLAPAQRASRPFFRETTPIIQHHIRPFTRAVTPVVRDSLRPAAANLAAATPDFEKAFGVLDAFLNGLAYNPPGKQEGYLFYLAWLNHITNSVLSSQDAQGAIRRTVLVNSCGQIEGVTGIARAQVPKQIGFSLLAQLVNAPNASRQSPGLCRVTPGGLR
jgi:phospholipid/cholesterol/gamma-HCH transport system substrate-binding protein